MTHGHHDPSHSSNKPWWKQVHRDWKFWTAVVLMIAALGVYVLSVDESLQPGGETKQPTPAAP